MFPCQCCAILEPTSEFKNGVSLLSVPFFLLDPPRLMVDMLPRVATINAGPEIKGLSIPRCAAKLGRSGAVMVLGRHSERPLE